MRNFASRLFVITGVVLLTVCGYLIWLRINPWRLSFDQAPQFLGELDSGKVSAVKIIIPKIGVTLPIYPAKIIANRWESTTKGVSHLSTSPYPGETGNSILYGHNYPNLLGRLPDIAPNDYLQIEYSDGQVKIFKIVTTATVKPSQSDILFPSQDSRITLYTCTGWFDSRRFVVVAVPEI